ncbi:MAG: radical SAM protein [Deltaproteobacteria bacterium]|jgi:pyruvate-formate lyase-activating enzyme|nr:radical SAM protein [Deltaproteobacteria bacterium]
MRSSLPPPALLLADPQGRVREEPDILLLCRRGSELALPRPDELMPLPPESGLFLLPDRRALGFNPRSGQAEEFGDLAVAAFAAPGQTLTAHPAYRSLSGAAALPLFAYGAVGAVKGRLYLCARKTDAEPRWASAPVSSKTLRRNALELAARSPSNRLLQRLIRKCALTWNCQAARDFCLGRHEAPLPVSGACNARCLGCISEAAPRERPDFTPKAEEVAELMFLHQERAAAPAYSFGQDCEGEPLAAAGVIAESIALFRAGGGRGRISLNTNASLPEEVARISAAGLSLMRVSLNSARPEAHRLYSRPQGFDLGRVRESMRRAVALGVSVTLRLLFFPGFSDSEAETQALIALIRETGADCLQLRNLGIDPEFYLEALQGLENGPALGFGNFRKRLLRSCPEIKIISE